MVDNFLLLPQLPQEAGLEPGPGGRLLLTIQEALACLCPQELTQNHQG